MKTGIANFAATMRSSIFGMFQNTLPLQKKKGRVLTVVATKDANVTDSRIENDL